MEAGRQQRTIPTGQPNTKWKVYTAKKTVKVKNFSDLKPGINDIFKISKQLRSDNQDVVSYKCVKMT